MRGVTTRSTVTLRRLLTRTVRTAINDTGLQADARRRLDGKNPRNLLYRAAAGPGTRAVGDVAAAQPVAGPMWFIRASCPLLSKRDCNNHRCSRSSTPAWRGPFEGRLLVIGYPIPLSMNQWHIGDFALYSSAMFFFSALLALRGTNGQARAAKLRWLADPNPLIAEAARRWVPRPRWMRSKARRSEWKALDVAIQARPGEWMRLRLLNQEFVAWNDLETAVALAGLASAVALVLSLIAIYSG